MTIEKNWLLFIYLLFSIKVDSKIIARDKHDNNNSVGCCRFTFSKPGLREIGRLNARTVQRFWGNSSSEPFISDQEVRSLINYALQRHF